jgi:MFS family permease
VLLAVAGAGIAPLFAATGALTGDLALPGTTTEAFAWTTTALAAGVAVGAALAGWIAEAGGTGPAFAASGAAGVVAAVVAVAWAPSLRVDAACGAS